MNRRHALLVSWLFPPHASIGAKRAYRFARALPSLGWDVTVLCGRAPPERFRDPTPWSVPDGVRVVTDYDSPWITSVANALDRSAHTNDAATSASSRPWLPDVQHALARSIPTETIAIHLPHALVAAHRIVRERRTDVVWTTSYPFSAHLIGLELRRVHGIPFVADLRDPWTLHFSHRDKTFVARAIETALERAVFGTADRITVTTESLARAYREAYPPRAERFVTVRNGFEAQILPTCSVPAGPARFVHFGHIYGERSLAPVFRAVAWLRERERLTPDDLVIENLGRMSAEDRACIASLALDSFVSVREPMPYADGLAYLRQSRACLLLAWGSEYGPLFVPGKLYDYLLAGAPIVAIGDNPEIAAILAETRTGRIVPADDVESLARELLALVRDRNARFEPDPTRVAAYSADRAAVRLVSIFDELSPGADRSKA